jgi:hypothetical protein
MGSGAPTVTRPRRARAARRCSDNGSLAPTWAGPGGSESGEARVAHGCAWAGPRRKRGGRAQMNNKVLHLFKLIETSSN